MTTSTSLGIPPAFHWLIHLTAMIILPFWFTCQHWNYTLQCIQTLKDLTHTYHLVDKNTLRWTKNLELNFNVAFCIIMGNTIKAISTLVNSCRIYLLLYLLLWRDLTLFPQFENGGRYWGLPSHWIWIQQSKVSVCSFIPLLINSLSLQISSPRHSGW